LPALHQRELPVLSLPREFRVLLFFVVARVCFEGISGKCFTEFPAEPRDVPAFEFPCHPGR